MAFTQTLRKVALGGQVSVLWPEIMGHGDWEPRAYVNSPSVKFCMGLKEDARCHPPFRGRTGGQGSMKTACVFRRQGLSMRAVRLGYPDLFLDTEPNCRECILVGTPGHRPSRPPGIPCHPCMLSQKDPLMTLSLICCALFKGR